MSFFFRLFLIYAIIFAPMVPYQAQAQSSGYSPVDVWKSPINSQGLYLGQNLVNQYRLLGFSTAPGGAKGQMHPPGITNQAFREALRGRNLVLSNPERLLQNSHYQTLLTTDAGRERLTRYYRGAFSALSVIRGENLTERFSARLTQLYAEVERQGKFRQYPQQVRQHLNHLESLRRLLAENFSSQERQLAQQLISQAQRLLLNPFKRAEFHFRSGLITGQVPPSSASLSPTNLFRHLWGQTLIRIQDPFGRPVDVAVPRTAQGMSKVDPVALMKQVKSGTIQTGILGLALLVVMYGAAEIRLLTNYSKNPDALSELSEQASSIAMPLSVATFFVGGWATKTGVDSMNVARRSMANLANMHSSGQVFANDPRLRANYAKANVNAIAQNGFLQKVMSYPGLTGGFLLSQLMFGWAETLGSCERVLDSGEYTPSQRQRYEQACQRDFQTFAKELMQSPQTWMQLVSLLSARALLNFAMSRAQLLRYGVPQNPQQASQAPRGVGHQVRIVSRGLLAPLVSAVVGVAVFYLVFEGLIWGMERIHGRLTRNVPTRRTQEDLVALLKDYREQGWDMSELCRTQDLRQGELMDYIRPLMFWRSLEERCGPALVSAFLNHYNQKEAMWRQHLLEPVEESLARWSNFTFKASNLFHGAYRTYKDLTEQMRLHKQSGQPLNLKRTEAPNSHAQEALGYVNTHLYNHPLPLFRSEPHFGWSSRVNPRENLETLSYPRYDGRSTNWQERWQNQVGVEDLEARRARFQNEVVPKARQEIREYLDRVRDPKEKQITEKILSLLSKEGDGALASTSHALELISRQLEDVNGSQGCRALNGNCFWYEFQKNYLDNELWAPQEDEGWQFLRGHAERMAYQTSPFEPYGVKPLGPGQGYFVRYHQRLQNYNIDVHFFPDGYEGFTDYVLKQMVCGLDPNEPVSGGWFPWMRPRFSPDLNLVRLPTNDENSQVCRHEDSESPSFRRGGRPGWGSPFYTYMEEVRDPSINYGGILDYLDQKLSPEVINDFDGWWQRVMVPRYEKLIGEIYQRYYEDELIDDQLRKLLAQDNRDENCMEGPCQEFNYQNQSGLGASVKQQMDTYFTYMLEPMSEDLPLDLRYVDHDSEEMGREQVRERFSDLKARVYDIFSMLSHRRSSLFHSENRELYLDLVAQLEEEARLSSGTTPDPEMLQLQALRILLRQWSFDMGVLFKTISERVIRAVFNAQIEMVNQIEGLGESQRQELIDELNQELQRQIQSFMDESLRQGHVLLDYNDWPDTMMQVGEALQAIEAALNELLEQRKRSLDNSN